MADLTRRKMLYDELVLRELLWLRHGCSISVLYGDDGEMQCGDCQIDFLRDNPDDISKKFFKIGSTIVLKGGLTF